MNKILLWVLIGLGVLIAAFAGVVVYENYISPEPNTQDIFPGPIMVKKPAIYLYPLSDSVIDVHVNVNGKLTTTIPEYNNGWSVFVTKEGMIEGQYDYLFYEAALNKVEMPDSGWVVPYGQLDAWFDTMLPKLGLSDKEKAQFKEYWLAELPPSGYYEIRLLDAAFLNKNMDLAITPKPTTQIRLIFYFKPLDHAVVLNEPSITTPTREGFTVVEWGGLVAS